MKFSDLSGRQPREEKRRTAVTKPAPAPEPAPAGPPPAAVQPPSQQPVPQAPAPGPETPPSPAQDVPQEKNPVPIQALRARRAQKSTEEAANRPKKPFKELDPEAREVYTRTITLAGELLDQIDRAYVEKYEKISRLATMNARALSDNPALLLYTAFSTGGSYLQAHTANVMLISQAMGIAMRLDEEDLSLLGFCAMAHDIGMTDCMDIAGSETKIGEKEYERIMLHSAVGAEKLDRVFDIDYKIKSRAMTVIAQVHERADGTGYPGGLSGETIDPLARIIGVADVFEAMSHPRPWRGAYHPHNAVKYLVDNEGKAFDARAVKALMEALALYPPGSLVALSSGEIARVVMVNKGSLTRPVVETLLDPAFLPVPSRTLDLMEHPLTEVSRIVEFEDIDRGNPKFAAKLELARWWMEW